jgi:homoserine O-acetyltransferase
MIERAAPIASIANTSAYLKTIADVLFETLSNDPNFNNGFYKDSSEVWRGLRDQTRVFTLLASTEFFRQEVWKLYGFNTMDDFLENFSFPAFQFMDPNNLLSQLWKLQRVDLSRAFNGDMKAAFRSIKAKVFVIPIDCDNYFPPRDCELDQKMIPNSELKVIKSIHGHLALFGADPDYMIQLDQYLKQLLDTPASQYPN